MSIFYFRILSISIDSEASTLFFFRKACHVTFQMTLNTNDTKSAVVEEHIKKMKLSRVKKRKSCSILTHVKGTNGCRKFRTQIDFRHFLMSSANFAFHTL